MLDLHLSQLIPQPTNKTLTIHLSSAVNPIGTCELQCDGKENPHKVKFYVVDVNSQPMLGLRDCENLVSSSNGYIIHTGQLIKKSYTTVFSQGLVPLGSIT